jgi:hypothetical protein
MLCVTSISYFVCLNGAKVRPIQPGRGLRQGDPLLSYLFILCNEGSFALIRRVEENRDIHGCKVCRTTPSISHLYFIDDSFMFLTVTTH